MLTPQTFTPFPVGEMPEHVKRWEDGPPFGRLALSLDHDPTDGEIVTDHETGEQFEIELNVACGFGCRCAANAKWVQ